GKNGLSPPPWLGGPMGGFIPSGGLNPSGILKSFGGPDDPWKTFLDRLPSSPVWRLGCLGPPLGGPDGRIGPSGGLGMFGGPSFGGPLGPGNCHGLRLSSDFSSLLMTFNLTPVISEKNRAKSSPILSSSSVRKAFAPSASLQSNPQR